MNNSSKNSVGVAKALRKLGLGLLFALGVLSTLATGGGGGGGGDGTSSPPPSTDQAIGGAWRGVDSNGVEILALSTENGRLHWLAPDTGEQGFGTGSVNGSAVSINYTYVAPLGFALADGSTSATCTATGTIQERQAVTLIANCTTDSGTMFSTSASLAYDPLYERGSSLAVIAGTYDDAGLVASIDANGVIFEQDPVTGCVVNGQVAIIDADFNAYDISITYSSCIGIFAVLNGTTFTGLGILDNTVSPEQAIVGLTGAAGGVTVSAIFTLPRISTDTTPPDLPALTWDEANWDEVAWQ